MRPETYIRFTSIAQGDDNAIEPKALVVRRADIRRVQQADSLVQFIQLDGYGAIVIGTNQAVCRGVTRWASPWQRLIEVSPAGAELRQGLEQARRILERAEQQKALQPPSPLERILSRAVGGTEPEH